MTKKWLKIIASLAVILPWQAQAELVIEITGGTEAALPIAIVPFGNEGPTAQIDISEIRFRSFLDKAIRRQSPPGGTDCRL